MTTPTRFRRLEALFHEVLDLAVTDRAAVLEALRRDDPELHDDLESLLKREASREDHEVPAAEAIAPGDRVGPFRIVRLLGEGGMGRVYEAEQLEPVRRRVALKLIQPHLWGPVSRARFARERQALAAMSHPGIAQVLEAGATPEGLPWVALELVEGEPITELCDRLRLPLAERIELMVGVLRAVQHAHRRGILHRDLKPSNLLVIERDGAREPKVIDFGLAKAVGGEEEAIGLQTRLGELLGTPEYMSPEQLAGGPVDTRTDVYSLGVVLHELLTGVRPHEPTGKGGLAAAEELHRQIREGDPRRPSANTGSGARAAEVAALRGHEPRGLKRALAGDLDWVLLRALAVDPERRYDSAAAFADDLEAYLGHRPVAAGPPSRAYRARKLLRRHRLAAVVTAIVALALIAVAAGTSILYLRAEAALDRAETERRKAEAVGGFLAETLARADPVESQSREDLSVRSLLDEAAWRIPSTLGDQPEVAAALHRTIGRAYRNLGLLERATDNLEQTVALSQRSGDLGGELQARLDLAEAWIDRGRHDEAWRLGSEALVLSARAGAEAPLWSARSRRVLGLVEKERGELEAAEATLRRGLVEAGEAGDGVVAARLQRDLGLLLADLGRLDEAIAALEEALAWRRAALGDAHSDVAESSTDLAWVLTGTRETDRALELQRQAVATLERVYPPDHPTVSVARGGMAGSLRESGRPGEAVVELERVLAAFRARLGDDHAYVAHTLNNLALALEQAGELERAVGLYRDTVGRYRSLYGADSPTVAITRSNLASALRTAGEPEAAERECLESLRIRRLALPPDHPDLARNLHLLAELRLDRGGRVEAVALLEEALVIRQRSLPAVHPLTAATLYLLGVTEAELERAARAASHLEASAAIYEALAATLPEVHSANVAKVRGALAQLPGRGVAP